MKRHNMVRGMFFVAVALAAMSASAGRAVRTFGWYRNAAQTDFQVPLVLEEGVDGFTYADTAADGANLCVTDTDGTQLPIEIENAWCPRAMPSSPCCTATRLAYWNFLCPTG